MPRLILERSYGGELDSAFERVAVDGALLAQAGQEYFVAHKDLTHAGNPDRVCFHIDLESGRIHAVLDSPSHFYGLIATLGMPSLERRYHELPEAGFDVHYQALVEEVRERLKRLFVGVDVKNPFVEFCASRSLIMTTMVADDRETELLLDAPMEGRQSAQ